MTATEIQAQCLHLAHKFGFVSRSMVWEFLSPKGRTARYKHWKKLKESPLFSPYILGSGSPEYLVLSSQGKKLMGVDSVSEVSTIYLTHDEMVMRFYLQLLKDAKPEAAWSEAELKKDRALSIRSLGDGVVSKLPDLLFDINIKGEVLRIALEVERTRKTQSRYQTMRRAYQRATQIDAILFGVSEARIEKAIEKEIEEAGLAFFGKAVGFFDLAEFQESAFQAQVRMQGKEGSLLECFTEELLKRKDSADSRRHRVREYYGEVYEVS